MTHKQVVKFLWHAIGHIIRSGEIDARVLLRRLICEIEGDACTCR